MAYDVALKSGVITVGSTWAIPADVWKHKLILIELSRWRGVATVIVEKNLLQSDIDMEFTLQSFYYGSSDNHVPHEWQISVTKQGVITLSAIGQYTGEPNIRVVGLF